MGTIGPRLRAAREARNLTVEQAAQDTRISLRFLQALEREEFEALPAPVYVRGFLRSYGNYLGLEPQSLLEELESSSGFEKGPAAYVRGPANGESAAGPRTADPFRSRAVATPAASPRGEWDPEPDRPPPPLASYEQPRGDYQPRAVPGVLVERGYEGGGSRMPLFVVAGGIGAIIILVVLIAVAALGGGDDDGGLPATGDDETPAATTEGGGQTVIAVGSATAATTAAPGEDTPTPAPGETEAPTATPPGPTDTPGPAPTATATVPPTDTPVPTATATSVPPTATPTELPFHPTAFQECTAAGLNDCGPGDLRVICGPRGWFVDYNHGVEPYPNPGWSEFVYTGRLFDLADVAEATCQ